ncbi:MAG: DUF262 domain-containing protein [Clostridium sp.]|nr:DUF262 domain-containing protein [Clostridium sp.]
MDTDNRRNKNTNGGEAGMYTLAQLFGYGFTPVIPDMQRDYCWGIEKTSSPIEQRKCSVFVEGLMRMQKAGGEGGRGMSIGLLYGYEYPKGSGSLNIIDGQQRLTTMYLMLGMIYRRIPETEIGKAIRRFLVRESDEGDVEPRLQYQSKSEAMYFLTDLVAKFFLSRSGRLSQIERSKWYFKSYDADINAQSFLGAIRSIDYAFEKELEENPDFDMEAFAKFLAHDINFRYFDMGGRAEAERAFITINTTGHPLTLAQNLRALAIGLVPEIERMRVAEEWNAMEDWFWRHRPLSMDAFLRLAIKSAAEPESADAGNFLIADLPRVYSAYARCVECGVDMENAFAAPPMLAYAMRFGNQAGDRDIERFGHLLCNYTRYQKTGAADRQQAMDLAKRMPSANLASVLGMRHAPAKILNEEEAAKIRLLDEYGFDDKLQSLLRKGEEHPMLRGRVAKVVSWCMEKSSGDIDGKRQAKFSISKLERYIGRIYEIWGVEIDRKDELDPVRRALLALRHKAYPIVRRGDMVLSLCWKDYDWQRLMQDAPGLVRQLIDHTTNLSLEEIAARFSDMEYPYGFIVKDPGVIDGCRKRQLLRPCDAFIGIYYLQSGHTQWWIEGRKLHIDMSIWHAAKPHGQMALHIEHKELNATIAIVYCGNARCRYRVELFRQESSARGKADLKAVAESLRNPMRYDRGTRRFLAVCSDVGHALKCAEEIMRAFKDGQI